MPADAVALVDGRAVTAELVRARVRMPPPPRIGEAVPIDPRREALDEAIRMHLFAAEAERRGLASVEADRTLAMARDVRALIADELERTGANAPITDEEVGSYYDAHWREINGIEWVRVEAISADGEEGAEQVFQQALRGEDPGFEELGTYDHEAQGLDDDVARLVLAFREPGQVGGPVRVQDGTWRVLRVAEIELERPPLDDELRTFVRNGMRRIRRQEALDALYERLRASATIEVDEEAVQAIPLDPR